MTDAALLREKNYSHNVVYEFDRSKQIRTFILESSHRALIFVCEDNLGSEEALLDLSVLEKLLESSPVTYNPGGVVDALSLVAKGNIERVILDESVFDRDVVYLQTVGRNAAIEIRPDDLRKILADLGFDSESDKPKLITYDFGYA
ncbi:hypothetical protein [Floridanema aerugineum]|uniref:Uncharacterized protein n=1 Tax=Floridaenema aerugineum BLCC-F46 TaxID=3153654 RepID=A0ABV4X823_9CYAN